jgi:hypothetical protein
MRCLFTMFAEDVQLIPADSFQACWLRGNGNRGATARRVGRLVGGDGQGIFASCAPAPALNGQLFHDDVTSNAGQMSCAAPAGRKLSRPFCLARTDLGPTERHNRARTCATALRGAVGAATVIEPGSGASGPPRRLDDEGKE